MSTELQHRVADQARLFVGLLTTLERDSGSTLLADRTTSGLAEALLQGFEDLYEAAGSGTAEAAPAVAALVDPVVRRREYRELVGRIRAKVAAVLPVGAIAAVITRGDGSLLQIPGLSCWHLPQNDLGVWAGFHPATGDDAVEQLELLRRRGAAYLLIPSPSMWWLSFYEQLAERLVSSASVVIADDDLALYALAPDEPELVATSAAGLLYRRQVEQFKQLVAALLPSGSTLSIATRGDDALLDIANLDTAHFPCDDAGRYLGTLRDDDHAVALLGSLVDAGCRHFALPAPMWWWIETYPELFRRLRRTHSCIADQREAGAVFELTPHREG